MNRLIYITARSISTILIPPTLFLFTFVFIAFYFESFENIIPVIGTTLIFGVIIPIALFSYWVKTGRVINQDATNKDERTTPYLYGIILYSLGFLLLFLFQTGYLTMVVWLTYLLNTAVILLINKYWKISAHAMGVAGPLGLFYFIFGVNAWPLFILLVLVSWSRIYLKCHTPLQVALGSLYGFFSVYLLLTFFVNYV